GGVPSCSGRAFHPRNGMEPARARKGQGALQRRRRRLRRSVERNWTAPPAPHLARSDVPRVNAAMDRRSIEHAAQLLGEARLTARQLANLPADCIPPNEASGYLIQDALYDWLAAQGLGCVGGYKVGLVSA